MTFLGFLLSIKMSQMLCHEMYGWLRCFNNFMNDTLGLCWQKADSASFYSEAAQYRDYQTHQ